MYDCETVVYPVAGKNHRCTWCDEPIRKGEQHHFRTGRYQGEWRNERYHPECFGAMRKMEPGDEFVPGDNERPKGHEIMGR